MKIFDNVSEIVRDDLRQTVKRGSKASILRGLASRLLLRKPTNRYARRCVPAGRRARTGTRLSMHYTSEQIEGCTVHSCNDGDLIACFDENIPETVIKTIANRQPLPAVFRDSNIADSPSRINVGEIFTLLAPDTMLKVLLHG